MPNKQDSLLSDITDLIISDQETAGWPVLPQGSRPRLLGALEHALINRGALHDYVRELQRRLGRQFRHTELLPDGLAEAVLERGLDTLDDSALAKLALNPVALYGLYDEIDEQLPEAWRAAMGRDGRALLQEHGLSVAPYETFTGGPPSLRQWAAASLGDQAGVGAPEETERPGPAPRQRWRFTRRAEECVWQAGDPASAAGQTATVEVEEGAEGLLQLAVSGFLRLGGGYTLHARWQAADGTVRGEGGVVDRVELMRLQSSDRQGPRPGDRLLLRHTWRPREGPGWEVGLEFSF